MSEAGCPGVADPGAVIVNHTKRNTSATSRTFYSFGHDGIRNEWASFTFHGYLPIEKK
jgi:16S rRNA (cytidine1402-2'-O)-methyltransferase